MSAQPKTDNRPEKSQTNEPAKGGLKPPHQNAFASGDSSKPHGDKLQHAADDAAGRKKQ